MPDLVAVPAVGSTRFVEVLQRTWEAGDAVLPVDPRLPEPARVRLLSSLRPTLIIEELEHGSTRTWRDDAGRPGEGVAAGDALVVATSGSTGEPKGAVLTHEAVEAAARSTSRRLGIDAASDEWLACLPLAHVGGLSVITRALLTGCSLVVHERPDPERILAASRAGATRTSLVAALLDRCALDGFATVLVGGGPAPVCAASNVIATYGMTETGGGIIYDGEPIDDVEIRIVDDEIHLRCPMLARAYRDGTSLTDADGWFATGDEGSLSSEGQLSVFGRRGDLIITGGEKVWPAPVERVLESHPQVAAALVVGRPDTRWGQAVTALVEPADRQDPPDLGSLRAWVAERRSAWEAPQRVEIVDALERTALGKVRRRR